MTHAIRFLAIALVSLATLAPIARAEPASGVLVYENIDTRANTVVTLFHRDAPDRAVGPWTITPGKRTYLSIKKIDKITVRGDWLIQVKDPSGRTSRRYRIDDVGFRAEDGSWHVRTPSVWAGRPPGIRLPIKVTRGSSTWTIDARGVVTSHIKYTVGSGSGSKKYTTGLIVEFSDGTIHTARATATIGRPTFGSRKGTKTNSAHDAIPVNKLNMIVRAYAKHSTSSSGPNTIGEWVKKAEEWAKEADRVYKELKDTDLARDAVAHESGG